jgi:hypothetical protein
MFDPGAGKRKWNRSLRIDLREAVGSGIDKTTVLRPTTNAPQREDYVSLEG